MFLYLLFIRVVYCKLSIGQRTSRGQLLTVHFFLVKYMGYLTRRYQYSLLLSLTMFDWGSSTVRSIARPAIKTRAQMHQDLQEKTMNKQSSFYFLVVSLLLIALSGAGTAAAQDNTSFGSGALANPSAINLEDSAFGAFALQSPTSGFANTAVGAFTLTNNSTGGSNTASGAGALYRNTTGANNTANGFDALKSNTTGADNTASGVSALTSNTSGNYNTATGQLALQSNISGVFNSATGQGALSNNLTGNDNTANGDGRPLH